MLDFSTLLKPQNQINLAYTWDKKLEEMRKQEKQQGLSAEMQQIKLFHENMQDMDKSNRLQSIGSKLNAGLDLTADELSYLQKHAPELYKEYVDAKREAENYKQQLKKCKTKEDVQKIKLQKLGSFMAEAKSISNNPNIPKGKKLGMMQAVLKKVMCTEAAHQEFTQSAAYANMPTDAEVRAEEKREAEATKAELTGEEKTPTTEEEVEAPVVSEETEETTGQFSEADVKADTEASREITPDMKQTDVTQERPMFEGADSFETVRRDVVEYLKKNRAVGGGLHLFES